MQASLGGHARRETRSRGAHMPFVRLLDMFTAQRSSGGGPAPGPGYYTYTYTCLYLYLCVCVCATVVLLPSDVPEGGRGKIDS